MEIETESATPTEVAVPTAAVENVFVTRDLHVYYGDFLAVRDVDLDIAKNEITAFIGPSGCGKSTVLRCFNRMNDLIDSARVEGSIDYHGIDLYGPGVDAVEVRRRIGMVFQKPNPFPKSIYDNLAFGPKISGVKKKSELDDIVESSLRRAALWDEVKDRLKASAMGMSGGQQQRLCIARAIAVEPDVILMDEPCSALDPIATGKIEELMDEIKAEYTIIIVTHNMQQAARVSDKTAFYSVEVNETSDTRTGILVEYDLTEKMFSNPIRRAHRALRDGKVRLMPEELRAEFHEHLDEIRDGIARLSAGVTELVPRATEILLSIDLEGAEYLVLGDVEYDRRSRRAGGSLLPADRAPATGCERSASAGGGDQDHRRRRTLGRPVRQHREGGSSDLQPRTRQPSARSDPEDGQPGATPVQGDHRGVSPRRRDACRCAVRHGQLPRRPASPVHPDDLREPFEQPDRSAGRCAVGARRTLLRTHR